MPPPVDHDEKRRRVIEVASRLLAKSGLGALTARDVAREAGYSTTIVTHYFKHKDKLLTPIFKYNHARFVTITDEALRKSGGDLKVFMTSAMLLEDHSIQWWRVWFAYLAQFGSHPDISSNRRDFTQEQRELWVVILNSMIARVLLKPGRRD
jgi:AcrR family transcriptional regulator